MKWCLISSTQKATSAALKSAYMHCLFWKQGISSSKKPVWPPWIMNSLRTSRRILKEINQVRPNGMTRIQD